MTPNPYQASDLQAAAAVWPTETEGTVVIEDQKISKATWRLVFGKQFVALDDAQGHTVATSDKVNFGKAFSFTPIGVKCIMVPIKGKKTCIRLSDDNIDQVISLLGVREWMEHYGKRGAKSAITWSVVILACAALQFSEFSEGPGPNVLIGWLWLIAGVTMLLNGLMAQRNPRPGNYLLQILSSGAIMVGIAIENVKTFSWIQLLFFVVLAMGLHFAYLNYQLFRRLDRHMDMPRID